MEKIRQLQVIEATAENFAPYGWIMGEPSREPDIDNLETKYWHSITPFKGFSDNQIINYFITKKILPVCRILESILETDEAYINVGVSRFILFTAASKTNSELLLEDLKAFLFKPGQSPVVKHKVWHWAPTPLDCDNRFLLLISGDNMIHGENGWDLNTSRVLVKRLECSYGVMGL